jgi:NTP pyrophosphatase (non-canonical NTP hydrolase)
MNSPSVSYIPVNTPEQFQQFYRDHPGSNSFIHVHTNSEASDTVRYDAFVAMLLKADTMPMMKLHAALGTCGEAGELADAIKKEIIYGKPMDRANIVEELGDLRFYIQAVMNLYKITEQEVLQSNAHKLAQRYRSLRYSDEAAIARADKNGSSEN